MDGTSPHTVDPAYPGACEKILNLSDCWDDGVFLGKEREIIDKTLENKQRHTRASRYIGAAASLISDNRKIADEYINQKEMNGYWKDVGVKITGRAVDGLTLFFLRQWEFVTEIREDYSIFLNKYENIKNKSKSKKSFCTKSTERQIYSSTTVA